MADEKNLAAAHLDPIHHVNTTVRGYIHEQEVGHETDTVLLDAGAAHLEKGDIGTLKLARDGHTVLVPQPSADPEDPLNWSWRKKHAILAIVSLTAFLGDFGSAAGVPLIVLQGEEWGMSPADVNVAGNLNVIMLGIGGLIWILISSWWGRAPVMFWSTLLGAAFTLACAVTTDFTVFYAFRALMGVTLTAFQVTGLACVKDMFFFHEHARKIGIWVALFIMSPYLSPFFGNFILAGTGNWRAVMWLVFAICCLDLVLIVLFMDETFYNRSIPHERQPARGSRMMRMLGVWQIKNHSYFKTFGTCARRMISTLFKPIMIPGMLYYAMSFMWAVGINITSTILLETPVVAGGYGFGPQAVGYLYFTPLVAVALGEGFGHWFNDFLANRYVRKHNGLFKPEARLWTNYIAAVFMIPGLIIVGQTLVQHLSYAGIVMGWGMYVFGVMLASVAITAYMLDSYPNASSEVAGYLNFARVVGGFSIGYFQQPWGAAQGYGISFGIQAAIVGAALIILCFLQTCGGWLRTKGGPVRD
ncbi:hypothetical protein MMC19_002183 [Ptychographa xylographoides]|nr:hypothetical protein [Ptychographa xylographoides]